VSSSAPYAIGCRLLITEQTVSRCGSSVVGSNSHLRRVFLGIALSSIEGYPTYRPAQGYNASRQLIYASTPNRTSQSLSTAEVAAAGFLSGIPSSLVTAPVERAKVLLQVQFLNLLDLNVICGIRSKGKGVLRPNIRV
jgi:hypothetical protein